MVTQLRALVIKWGTIFDSTCIQQLSDQTQNAQLILAAADSPCKTISATLASTKHSWLHSLLYEYMWRASWHKLTARWSRTSRNDTRNIYTITESCIHFIKVIFKNQIKAKPLRSQVLNWYSLSTQKNTLICKIVFIVYFFASYNSVVCNENPCYSLGKLVLLVC